MRACMVGMHGGHAWWVCHCGHCGRCGRCACCAHYACCARCALLVGVAVVFGVGGMVGMVRHGVHGDCRVCVTPVSPQCSHGGPKCRGWSKFRGITRRECSEAVDESEGRGHFRAGRRESQAGTHAQARSQRSLAQCRAVCRSLIPACASRFFTHSSHTSRRR